MDSTFGDNTPCFKGNASPLPTFGLAQKTRMVVSQQKSYIREIMIQINPKGCFTHYLG